MTRLTTIKLVLAAVGVAVVLYGIDVDDMRIRWVGIGIMAVAVILRFVKPRTPSLD